MDIQEIKENYNISDIDIEKINTYVSQSELDESTLNDDYINKKWFVEGSTRPKILLKISEEYGFDLNSDIATGSLLSVLAASKPKGNILEIGTGCGVGTNWLLQGMCKDSKLTTIESNPKWYDIASSIIDDDRALLLNEDASSYLKTSEANKFDLVFADALPGKYFQVNDAIRILKPGGYYIIDDCRHQDEWPKEIYIYHRKIHDLLKRRKDIVMVKMDWSVGVILAVKL